MLCGAIRPTRLVLRGRYSSMMDLGGVAAADVSSGKLIDAGKNNKIQAVALDFDLLIRNLDAQRARADQASSGSGGGSGAGASANNNGGTAIKAAMVAPNTGMVENMAKLLNVDLGGMMGRKKDDNDYDDDLSKLGGGAAAAAASSSAPAGFRPHEDEIGSSILLSELSKPSPSTTSRPTMKATTTSTKAPPVNDARAKYANKLRKKLDGGLAGVENAKAQQEDALKRGDAAGHWAARKIASSQPVGTAGSKWLAATGTGNLLVYLTNRSMKIALLPVPHTADAESNDAAARRMDDLEAQLPQVRFDLLVKDGQLSPSDILGNIQQKADVPSGSILVVSDRDDYLREAKERGYYTCRIRPKNAPRGNVTTNYTVSGIQEVEDVCNELNGISFNTVFSGVGINHGGV